ncbi:14763_t:CDS:1, partial [Acaulospora colombiana]
DFIVIPSVYMSESLICDVAISAPVVEEAAKEPAKDENNIGNKLLKKMGWSEGTGLGLSGEGRVDPM